MRYIRAAALPRSQLRWSTPVDPGYLELWCALTIVHNKIHSTILRLLEQFPDPWQIVPEDEFRLLLLSFGTESLELLQVLVLEVY